jgi:hypothetical protein
MRLLFTKDGNNEILVQLQKGTIVQQFNYTEMVKQLLVDNNFEDTIFENLTDEEIEKINLMLDKIKKVFNDSEEIDEEESLL